MKKNIYRNIAIVTAIFALTLSIMLITNYFQVRKATPLQTEVVQTLKELNDVNADNLQLQEQIRQLDLLSRRAYFVQRSHLKTGLYLLLGMLGVLLVCLRLYYSGVKDIPEKEIDHLDDWLIQSKARKYVLGGAGAVAVAALVFAFLSSPYYSSLGERRAQKKALAQQEEFEAPQEEIFDAESFDPAQLTADATAPETEAPEEETAPQEESQTEEAASEEPVVEQPVISTVTHNAFRGNNSNGQSNARGVPVNWDLSAGSNIAWKVSVAKPGFNSPVLNGRNVFLTGADASARELYCYDLLTGELRWTLAADGIAGSPSTMPTVNGDTGLAASSVATNGSQVCAIFATGDIICADIDGNRLWAKNLGVPDNHYGFASSLLIYGGEVIVQYDNDSDGKLIALNLSNGNVRWTKSRTEKATWSSPIIAYIDGKAQLVVMGNPALTAYNPDNGEMLWKVDCMSGEVGASPCSSNGIVYGASEYASLVAVNAQDGSLLWEANDYLPEVSSPVATKDYVYVATSYGMLIAYDASNGEILAEQDLGTQFYCSPMLVEGKIYIFGTEGNMYIFSNDGKLTLLRTIQTGEPTFATPAFTDGKIVVRSTESLYCVSAS
ncbi:MAG: PQQ-binding-like beta-propeller repeat protein [Bacteroidales bacterium]|nr:PQQ-binding-like beta-propeller repeat protein [Bacteroidales bacterium]